MKGHHCQPVKWTRFEARRLGGGRRVPEKTLSSCLAACVADISCISIDWRIGGCVLHSHSEANRTMQLDRRPLNHYRLNRNYCRGKRNANFFPFIRLFIHIFAQQIAYVHRFVKTYSKKTGQQGQQTVLIDGHDWKIHVQHDMCSTYILKLR